MSWTKWWFTTIAVVLTLGAISMYLDSNYIDINEFIAASMLMPTAVLKWFQDMDLVILINKTWPILAIVSFILIVVRLRKPSKN
jgi:hypothetical protein